MFAVISALKSEIEPFLNKRQILSVEKTADGTLYVAPGVHLLRLGLGGKRAAHTLKIYLQKYAPAFLLNIGFAGNLSAQQFQPCGLFAVQTIFNVHSAVPLSLSICPGFEFLPSVSLLTTDEAVLKKEEKERLFLKFGTLLVDMEAYDLALTAHAFGIPFYALKSVTDASDEETAQVFKARYKQCAQKLFATVQPVLFK